jgi:PPOX class probable F420-dependent enzyme
MSGIGSPNRMNIDPSAEEVIERARVARLATANAQSRPHLVPVVFVYAGMRFLIPIDKKRKTVEPQKLRRLMNIRENPDVALLIDEYDEDWTKLTFVMIQGKASILNKLHDGNTWLQQAYQKLTIKYPQYQKFGLEDTCIMVEPKKAIFWQNAES